MTIHEKQITLHQYRAEQALSAKQLMQLQQISLSRAQQAEQALSAKVHVKLVEKHLHALQDEATSTGAHVNRLELELREVNKTSRAMALAREQVES